MSIRNYKVLRVFEHDGESLKLGAEVAMSDREAAPFIAKRLLADGHVLDRNDEKDAKLIAKAETRYKQKYEANAAKDQERDDVKQKEHLEKDEKRRKLINQATTLAAEIAGVESFQTGDAELEEILKLDTASLEKHILQLKEQKEKLSKKGTVPSTTTPKKKK